ncbi:alpha-ketoglutarate-dependent dioxygenase AlkB [Caulobacter endophyticus]|uniref:alpha-ketoglutarate-dependent dioxygenase AlkB n=1 Tax=Caulobacter endophyticus TaxID=2172652 RepID=UPI0024105551|nr:alpha-ketoglutarate-dependent dioxygenase AlkB [Caulobacter endophyticus]MDG2528043.1 alpha-ketoglutarate-dependent dioxygenase AlkB [Caulobacter endophyticus]
MPSQPALFDLPDTLRPAPATGLPKGLAYRPDLIAPAEEAALIEAIAALPLAPFQFHGYQGNRRVVSFGWSYDFERGVLEPAAPIPGFLLPLRGKVAALAGRNPDDFRQALVIEYAPGAGIGWHRDRPQFEIIAGVSLGSSCPLRFRRALGDGFERATLRPAPRSAYVLTGPAREVWEHSIPPVAALRYSVTFRTFRKDQT